MFESIAAIIQLALTLWVHKDKQKYVDKYNEIEGNYRAEMAKDYLVRDHALLDECTFEMHQLARNIATDAGVPYPVAKT